MRISSVILLPLLALMGFGFCLAYSLNLTRELIDIRDQLTRVQAERQALEAQYQVVVEEKNRLAAQMSGMAGENANLHTRIQELESECLLLRGQLETMQEKVALVERAHPLLTWLVEAPAGRMLAALIVVPVIPLSLGAVYVMTSKRTRLTTTLHAEAQADGTYMAMLTREELRMLARQRRS